MSIVTMLEEVLCIVYKFHSLLETLPFRKECWTLVEEDFFFLCSDMNQPDIEDFRSRPHCNWCCISTLLFHAFGIQIIQSNTCCNLQTLGCTRLFETTTPKKSHMMILHYTLLFLTFTFNQRTTVKTYTRNTSQLDL